MAEIDAPDWTPSEVVQQLKLLGLGKYGNNFLENDINGEALLYLQDSHLKELGIKLIGHRLTLVNFINDIKSGNNTNTAKPQAKPAKPTAFDVEQTNSSEDEEPPAVPSWKQKKPQTRTKAIDPDPAPAPAPVRKMHMSSVDQFGRSKPTSKYEDAAPPSRTSRPNSRVQAKPEIPEDDIDDFDENINPFESKPKVGLTDQVSPMRDDYDDDNYDDYEVPKAPARRAPAPVKKQQPMDDEMGYSKPAAKRATPRQTAQQTRNTYDEDDWERPAPANKRATPTYGRKAPQTYNDSDEEDTWHKPVSRQQSGRQTPIYDDYEDESPPPPPARKTPPVSRQSSGTFGQPSPYADEDTDRVPCRYCGRKFASDRLDKHEQICAKASKKKTKVFDTRAQRMAGTGAEKYIGKIDKEEPPKPKKDRERYKIEHQKLVETLRSAREYTEYENKKAAGKAVGPPPEMPKYEMEEDDRVSCPHCGRKFASEAAKKHIPVCERMSSHKSARGPAATTRGRRW